MSRSMREAFESELLWRFGVLLAVTCYNRPLTCDIGPRQGTKLTQEKTTVDSAGLTVSSARITRNRFDRLEWAGAFGDLGTLIPFVLAYVSVMVSTHLACSSASASAWWRPVFGIARRSLFSR